MSAGDAFGTFLETKDLLRKRDDQVEETPVGVVAEHAGDLPTQAFNLLLSGSFPAPVAELLDASGLPLVEFTDALARLQAAGLVLVQNENGRQVAVLTDQGRTLRAA
jgi:hypothetical protein